MKRQKVFCVGLGKTGTTSVKEALRMLGYRTIRLPLDWKGITEFDAALPGVSAAMFKELDAEYPNSKFILTVRDVEGWLKSIERDMARKKGVKRDRHEERKKLLMLKYGTTTFDAEAFRKAFHEHEAKVVGYFKNRPEDLLVLNVTKSAGWEPLCSFLNESVPGLPFPYANKAAELDALLVRLLHVIRDVEVVAGISKYSRKNIENLAEKNDVDKYDLSAPFHLKDDRRINKVVKRACAYFGSPARAAEALNIHEHAIKEALARQKKHAREKIKTMRPLAKMRRLVKKNITYKAGTNRR